MRAAVIVCPRSMKVVQLICNHQVVVRFRAGAPAMSVRKVIRLSGFFFARSPHQTMDLLCRKFLSIETIIPKKSRYPILLVLQTNLYRTLGTHSITSKKNHENRAL